MIGIERITLRIRRLLRAEPQEINRTDGKAGQTPGPDNSVFWKAMAWKPEDENSRQNFRDQLCGEIRAIFNGLDNPAHEGLCVVEIAPPQRPFELNLNDRRFLRARGIASD